MSTTSRRRNITDALVDIRAAARGLGEAERHLNARAPGIRAASYDPTSRPAIADDVDREFGPALISDPTGNRAIAPDAVRAAGRRLDMATKAFARAAAELRACVTQAIADAAPTPEELTQLEAKAEPGCEIVGRITRPDDGPNYWEPVLATTDFAGLLARPFVLGAWAHKFVQRNGRLPVEHEVIAHCEGRRVMVKQGQAS